MGPLYCAAQFTPNGDTFKDAQRDAGSTVEDYEMNIERQEDGKWWPVWDRSGSTLQPGIRYIATILSRFLE